MTTRGGNSGTFVGLTLEAHRLVLASYQGGASRF